LLDQQKNKKAVEGNFSGFFRSAVVRRFKISSTLKQEISPRIARGLLSQEMHWEHYI